MNASLLDKVIVIPGDIVLPGLGISDSYIELISQEVSIVFHSAATVKFDEPMRFVNYSFHLFFQQIFNIFILNLFIQNFNQFQCIRYETYVRTLS